MSYPVQLHIQSPPRFERLQLLLRLVLAIALGWVGITAGAFCSLLYIALPAIAAVAVSTRGSAWYEAELAPKLWRALRWLFAFSAYMLLLTDRFPAEAVDRDVAVEMHPTGARTLGSTLARLITSIPSGLALALLSIISCIFAWVSVITILVDHTVPATIRSFQEGIVRWQARLAAYHASLVEEYPPFSFEHDEPQAAFRAS